jgi:hypothetical protein
MNDKLKYALLIVTYDNDQLAIPLWTIISIRGMNNDCLIETSDGHNNDSWLVTETFMTVMERYLNLRRSV